MRSCQEQPYEVAGFQPGMQGLDLRTEAVPRRREVSIKAKKDHPAAVDAVVHFSGDSESDGCDAVAFFPPRDHQGWSRGAPHHVEVPAGIPLHHHVLTVIQQYLPCTCASSSTFITPSCSSWKPPKATIPPPLRLIRQRCDLQHTISSGAHHSAGIRRPPAMQLEPGRKRKPRTNCRTDTRFDRFESPPTLSFAHRRYSVAEVSNSRRNKVVL